MKLPTSLHRPATRLLLLIGAITIVVLMVIRTVALHGYDSLTPIFFRLLVLQDDVAAMAMVLMIIAAAVVTQKYRWTGALEWCGRRPAVVASAITVALCLGALLIYRNTRLSMDEYAVYFQSQVFASGNLVGMFPAELRQWLVPNGFLVVSPESGGVASPYLPGFALLLTPFTLAGIPWACNAVLTGLTVLVIHRLAMRLYSSHTAAGVTVLMLVASPVVLANGISYYSMTACMLFNALFALLLLSELTPRRLLLAGLVGSVALTLHSPARHAPFALPWLIWVLTRPQGVRNIALLGAGYLPLTLVLGLGWLRLNALLGDIGVEDYEQSADVVFTLPTTQLLVARVAALTKLWVWAVPGLALLAAMGLWLRRRDARVIVIAASGLCLLGAYLFVSFDQGHGWGYRYFHSAWFVLPILAGALAAPRATQPQAAEGMRTETLNLVAALAIISLLVGTTLRSWQIRTFIDEHLAQQPTYTAKGPQVLFIDTGQCFYCIDLIQNDPWLAGNILRLHSHGSVRNAAVAERYWPGYRLMHRNRFGEVYAPVSSLRPGHE